MALAGDIGSGMADIDITFGSLCSHSYHGEKPLCAQSGDAVPLPAAGLACGKA